MRISKKSKKEIRFSKNLISFSFPLFSKYPGSSGKINDGTVYFS